MISYSDEEREFVVAAKNGDLHTLHRCAVIEVSSNASGSVLCFNRLLERGVDVNGRHPLGWTALHSAVINREHKCVRL